MDVFTIHNALAQRGDIKLISQIGFAVTDITVDLDGTEKTMRVNLSCLHDNWELRFEPETEEFAAGCRKNKVTYDKGGTYKAKVDYRQLNLFMQSATMGGQIVSPSATDLIMMYKSERLAVDALHKIQLSEITDEDDLKIILSVQHTGTGVWYYMIPIDQTPNVNKPEYALETGTENLLGPASGTYVWDVPPSADIIAVKYVYLSSTATDGYIVRSMGDTMPSEMDLYLTWVGMNTITGDKFYVIAKALNAHVTSPTKMGGVGSPDKLMETLELTINEEEDGDVEFHWGDIPTTYEP